MRTYAGSPTNFQVNSSGSGNLTSEDKVRTYAGSSTDFQVNSSGLGNSTGEKKAGAWCIFSICYWLVAPTSLHTHPKFERTMIRIKLKRYFEPYKKEMTRQVRRSRGTWSSRCGPTRTLTAFISSGWDLRQSTNLLIGMLHKKDGKIWEKFPCGSPPLPH